MAEPEAYTLSPKTAKAVQALLAAPDAYAPGGFGGRETTGGVSAVLEVVSLVSLAPRPHYLAKPDNARGLSLAPSAGNTVVVACLDPAAVLTAGQHVLAAQFGTHLGKPLYWCGPPGGGFYASLSGASSPYSFAEVVGPAVGSAAVAGGRTGTANATEVLTGLAAIPAGTVVWMTAGGVTAYQFACVKIVYVTAWQINTGSPCTITPATTVTYYLSSANLCGRAV